jgi:hypothetical protein
MALTATTLSAAVSATATSLTVTSATGFAAGNFLRVNDEFLYVQEVTGTTLKAQRGRCGTLARAHGILSIAVTGLPADFVPVVAPQMYTYGAAGAITPAKGLHRLKAASAAAMTLVAPTADQEGDVLRLIAVAAQAYTVTLASGYFNATTNNKLTFGGAIGDVIDLIAINGSWDVTLNKNVTVGT